MKRFLWFCGNCLVVLLIGFGVAQAQFEKGPLRTAQRITVFVRGANNSAVGAGINVKLEASPGGLVDERQTDSSGKVTFWPKALTTYVVIIHELGFKEVTRPVDLSLTPTAFVNVQLIPLPGHENEVPGRNSNSSDAVSAQELGIPEPAKREFDQGEKLLQKDHNAAKSISRFRRAIELYDHFSQAYTLMGLAYLQEKNLKDSQVALQKAVELDPKSGAAYLTLGACLNQQKDYPGAEKALLQGLELNAEAPEGHYELAKTYWAMHRWQDAEPHAEKSEKLQPDVPGVHVLMGNILLQKRDGAGALKEFNEYLRLDPKGSMSDAVRAMVSKLEKAQAATH